MYREFARVAGAYNLSERQDALLRALVDTGGIREAAVALNIPYTSARNMVAELKTKLGVGTVPMMIGLLLDLTLNDAGGIARPARRHDLFSLSERQFAIARGIGIAKSRREIAVTLKLSDAVLNNELKEIYLILGVRNAGELIGIVADTGLVMPDGNHSSAIAPASGHDLPMHNMTSGSRRIGYSDFGPADATPVLILHSTITSRPPPTRLVAALHAAGFRPIAIDRPGFGDTDPAGSARDPYLLAAHDTAGVAAALGIARLDVVARGSGQAASRLAQLYPALVRRAVLINPTPAIGYTTVDRGPLGAVKRAIGKRPLAVEAMIRLLSAYATPRRLVDGMLRSFRESPPDIHLVRNDPQFAADYLRAVHGFALGHIAGYVAEQSAWGGGYDIAPMPGMAHWRIVQGRHFILHDPEQAMAYWRVRLPDTPIDWIDDAGQMLAYSHPATVVAALSA